jgi:hypothetical protein
VLNTALLQSILRSECDLELSVGGSAHRSRGDAYFFAADPELFPNVKDILWQVARVLVRSGVRLSWADINFLERVCVSPDGVDVAHSLYQGTLPDECSFLHEIFDLLQLASPITLSTAQARIVVTRDGNRVGRLFAAV